MRFVKNEWIKIWAQKNAWIMLILVLLGVAAILGISKYYAIDQSTPELREEANKKWLADYNAQLSIPELSEQDLQYLNDEILMTEYRIANDLPAIDAMGFHDVFDILLTFILTVVGIFTMVVAASIVSNEFGTGTIKMLLTRPAARWKILLSKLVASLLYGLALFAVSVVVALAGSYILFNTGEAVTLSVVNGQVVEQVVETHFVKTIVLNAASIFMTTLFAFMLGTIFGSSTLAVSLSLVLLLMGSTVTMFLAKYEFAKYIWFANDLTQFQSGMMAVIPDLTLNFAIVVNIVYAIIFLAVSFTYFIRRDVTA
ncbi:ABC transporter permease subunit [Ureibacillus sp. MALMAid1270]|uniref:ABC transporter permease subunit n=1 Tax=Ureibacillus sp. MALMAid1270 TaxID=3411629 RepID=UPI003BA7B694